MNRLRMGRLGGVAFLVASATLAQGIGWLDLTDLHPRERIRTPHAFSGGCGGGAGFEPALSASITLTDLDKTSYSVGEEVTYEVKIQNTGKEPIEIPWTPHLGDLEPADSSQPYTYLDAAISLDFTEPVSNRSFSIYANSYGSSNVAGTTRKLLPRESVFVRARQELHTYEEWWQGKIMESSPLNMKVSANLVLSKVTYSPGERSNPAIDQSLCIPLRTTLGAPLDAALLPAKSN
jgi:hypothetical protein